MNEEKKAIHSQDVVIKVYLAEQMLNELDRPTGVANRKLNLYGECALLPDSALPTYEILVNEWHEGNSKKDKQTIGVLFNKTSIGARRKCVTPSAESSEWFFLVSVDRFKSVDVELYHRGQRVNEKKYNQRIIFIIYDARRREQQKLSLASAGGELVDADERLIVDQIDDRMQVIFVVQIVFICIFYFFCWWFDLIRSMNSSQLKEPFHYLIESSQFAANLLRVLMTIHYLTSDRPKNRQPNTTDQLRFFHSLNC